MGRGRLEEKSKAIQPAIRGSIATAPEFCRRLGRFLPNHFLRIFVFSQPEEDWLAETIVSRPFCEFDFANENWLYPMAVLQLRRGHWFSILPAPLFRKISKRTLVAPNFFELGKKRPEHIFLEAR